MISWTQRLSIRAQIFMLAMAVLLPTMATFTWFLGNELASARKDAHAKVNLLAENTAASLEPLLRDYETMMGRLAVRPGVRALDASNIDPIIREFIGIHPEFNNLGLRDLDGNNIFSFQPRPSDPVAASKFPWFKTGVTSEKFAIGDAFFGRLVGRWVSVLTFPVRDNAGKLAGFLNLPMDLQKLNERIFRHPPTNAVIAVLDRNHTILLRSAEPDRFIGKPAPADAVALLRDNRSGLRTVTDITGIPRLIATTVVPGTDWLVVAGVPESEAFAEFDAMLRRSLAIGLGVLMLALALAWRIGVAIVRPITQLAGVAQRVAAGDHSVRSAEDGPPEIAMVAGQFNRMLDARDADELALRSSEENLSITLQSIGDAVIATDTQGSITRMNPMAEQLTAWPQSEAIGKPLREIFRIVNAITRVPSDNPVELVMARGEIVGLVNHTALLARDGKEHQISDSAAPIRNRAGQITGVVLVFSDVTEAYGIRQTLATTAAMLERIGAVARVGGWELDLKTMALLWSAETFRIHEIDPPHAPSLEQGIAMYAPESQPVMRAAMLAAIDSGKPYDLDLRKFTATGREIWVRTQGAAVMENGKAVKLIGAFHDITERKHAEAVRSSLEAQLRESQKMEAIGTLAGGVAHDFNNILATIIGNTDLARQDLGSNPTALESLDEIRKASMRARALVQQILSFSRRQPTERKVIALSGVIEESARLLRATLPPRLALDVQCDIDVPVVLADATQIEQIIVNLVTNAMHALRGGKGLISIQLDTIVLDSTFAEEHPSLKAMMASRPGRTVRLRVSDDGQGMDAATLARIFEPFFTTKPVDEGTGLGLSVVHGIVVTHEGAIEVDSQLGKGTTFAIYLPVASAEELADATDSQAASASAVAVEAMPESRQHILYIDDDESLVFLIKRLLERRGFRTSGFTDQKEALEALRANPADVDLVVSDYNMPGLSGLDVAREVKSIRADLLVAVASGFIDETLRSQANGVGVCELIFKANAVEDLCEAFARLARSVDGKK